MSPIAVDTTWLTRITLAVVLYYALLLLVRAAVGRFETTPTQGEGTTSAPLIVLVVPSYNEEAVIEQTVTSLLELDYEHRLIIVMNDGSKDATSDIARAYEAYGVLHVIDRDDGWATQRGKGSVLNHAFQVLQLMWEQDHPLLQGRAPDDVVIGVMDADGQLDRNALSHVAPLFTDPRVGGVQIGVRIANASDNWLTRMQDIEFVGFSGFVQHARNAFGSVGLGGNGQFTRLSALLELKRLPWTDCLSEDLDLGLSLVEAGYQVRFCPTTYVAQQGLQQLRPLVKQRTRWVQGHYQCWKHLPRLAKSTVIPWRTKADLTLYLTMIVFVLLVGVSTTMSVAGAAGLLEIRNHALDFVPPGIFFRVVLLVLSFGPPVAFLVTYQRRAENPLPLWAAPAYLVVFCVYGYHWLFAQLLAFARMARGQRNWVKTGRLPAQRIAPVLEGAAS